MSSQDKGGSTSGIRRRRKFIGCSPVDHFELGEKVGVGTFGEVVKAKHTGSGKNLAMKKIFTRSEQEGFPITSLREIRLLKSLSHPNVATLVDMAVSCSKSDNGDDVVEDVFMVFPFMDHDMTGILENREMITLTVPQIKCYMKQMLEGLEYLHSRRIMHRDMKGANLLVNNRGELKITDFGLARPLENRRLKYTPGVVTRGYRPPELLLSCDEYSEAIDVWGAACIIAEMYLRKPLFSANSDLDQLKLVCRFCGSINEESFPGISKKSLSFESLNLPTGKRMIREYLLGKGLDAPAVDLIDAMLAIDPRKRITAKEALRHAYFYSEPLPCSPSDIPKFVSSHEFTVKRTAQGSDSYVGHAQPPPPPPPPTDSHDRHRHNSSHYREPHREHHRYHDYDGHERPKRSRDLFQDRSRDHSRHHFQDRSRDYSQDRSRDHSQDRISRAAKPSNSVSSRYPPSPSNDEGELRDTAPRSATSQSKSTMPTRNTISYDDL